MVKVQSRFFVLIIAIFISGSCKKQTLREARTLSHSMVYPLPIPFTDPRCSIKRNSTSSVTDNFNNIQFNDPIYSLKKNHHFIFTNNNHDSLILSMINFQNQNCNFRSDKINKWWDNKFINLNSVAINVKMNSIGKNKMTGWITIDNCNAELNADNTLSLHFCDAILSYLPSDNNSLTEVTAISLKLEIPVLNK